MISELLRIIAKLKISFQNFQKVYVEMGKNKIIYALWLFIYYIKHVYMRYICCSMFVIT